uniref:Methyltransferase-like protein 5 n=1 Tax=Heterorhabditis bacteriophora TaxID=37862 RepID=A0A1I7XKK1_HETBA
MINSLVGLDGSLVADLGCGSGILMTAIASAYEPLFVLGVDIDRDALSICKENLVTADTNKDYISRCGLLSCNVTNIADMVKDNFDVIVMNPPFGTKNNSGLDIAFVQAGLSILTKGGSLFSLHKSSTRNYILKKVDWRDMGVEVFTGRVYCSVAMGLTSYIQFSQEESSRY